jgi:hypothetical protein
MSLSVSGAGDQVLLWRLLLAGLNGQSGSASHSGAEVDASSLAGAAAELADPPGAVGLSASALDALARLSGGPPGGPGRDAADADPGASVSAGANPTSAGDRPSGFESAVAGLQSDAAAALASEVASSAANPPAPAASASPAAAPDLGAALDDPTTALTALIAGLAANRLDALNPYLLATLARAALPLDAPDARVDETERDDESFESAERRRRAGSGAGAQDGEGQGEADGGGEERRRAP